MASEMDWSPTALNAMATTPSENTVLYAAQSVVKRGATVEVTGSADVDVLQRYVEMPALSSRAAHVALDRRVVDDTGAGLVASRSFPVLSAAPSSYQTLCSPAWQSGYSSDPHPCAEDEFKDKCLTGSWQSCLDPAQCASFACTSYAGTTDCLSSSQIQCTTCVACYTTGGVTVWADSWKALEEADATADTWRNRCASHCIRVAPRRYQLAYVQVDLSTTGTAVCSCYETLSPQLPSDADVTSWLTNHTEAATGVHLYVIRAKHPRQQLVQSAGGTVNYAQSFHAGVTATLTVVGTALSSTLDGCIEHCAISNGAILKGIAHDPVVSYCQCFSTDPTDESVNGTLQYQSSSTTLFYSASLCLRTRPDPAENSFAWTRSTQEWCPGYVSEDGLGVSAINGSRFSPVQSADYGVECAHTCTDACQFAELSIAPWRELAGAVLREPRSDAQAISPHWSVGAQRRQPVHGRARRVVHLRSGASTEVKRATVSPANPFGYSGICTLGLRIGEAPTSRAARFEARNPRMMEP